ncbi:MAG: DUF3617 domain-containing protein [Azoarcus sp.]|jgi:hypothetical protein|nr:DUF3617 domain-containing protein [Azoarcus sp.]
MKRYWFACGGWLLAMFSLNAVAEPGEYWEMTTKVEMPGMPMAMPAQTYKICVGPGKQGDPGAVQQKDSDCQYSDMQRSGNTVKFKGTCTDKSGSKMTMTGEITSDSNSFKSVTQMQTQGLSMNMTSNGKRVGGNCDTKEMSNIRRK